MFGFRENQLQFAPVPLSDLCSGQPGQLKAAWFLPHQAAVFMRCRGTIPGMAAISKRRWFQFSLQVADEYGTAALLTTYQYVCTLLKMRVTAPDLSQSIFRPW